MTFKRRLIAGAVSAAVLLTPGAAAHANVLNGTVVHHNARAHSFVVAARNGRLSAVHAARSPRVGRTVRVVARKLSNGTYAARRVRVGRAARRARLRGTVSYANRRRHAFVVSAKGVSLLVHTRSLHGRRARSAAADALPTVGSDVTVDATVDPQGNVIASRVDDHGEDTGGIELEGTVIAIDKTTRTLELSADDSDASGAAIVVALPDTFDLSAFRPGDEIALDATLNADGTYTGLASSQDGDANQADDSADDQSDSADDQGDSADDQGDSADDQGDSPDDQSDSPDDQADSADDQSDSADDD